MPKRPIRNEFLLVFETHFSAKIQVQSSNQGLIRIVITCGVLLRWKSIDILPHMRSLLVKKI